MQQAGENPKSSIPYTLTVTSQLVLLDVVVRDQRGNVVTDLKKDDFTVLEDGIPQPIAAFEAVNTTTSTPGRRQIHSTEELDEVEPNSPVTILVLDELTTKFEDEYFARYSLGKYLDSQGETLNEPTMLLARTYGRTVVLHDYTTSRKEILDALNRHLVGNDWRATNPDQAPNLFGAAFASLIEVAKATEGHPGHKNVIWLGRGFPSIQWANLNPDQADALRTAIVSCSNLLRSARITLYSLDPSGISVAQESTLDPSGQLTQADPFGGQIDFDALAQSTGGIAMHGRNDVDRMIGQAVTNGEIFYSLGYRPHSLDSDPKKFHQIKVVMKNPGLTAISRVGYFDENQQPAAEDPDARDVANSRSLDLAGAINDLMVYSGIPLTVTRSDEPNQYRISLPARALGLAEVDGKMTAQVDLIVLSFDRFGKVLGESGKVLTLHLPLLSSGRAEDRNVVVVTDTGDVVNPARVRFVVRAHADGRIGAENYFLIDRNSLMDPATGLKAAKPRVK